MTAVSDPFGQGITPAPSDKREHGAPRPARVSHVPVDGDATLVASERAGDLVFLNYAPADGSGCDPELFVQRVYAPLAKLLVEQDCVLLNERIFGEADAAARVLSARQELLAPAGARAASAPTFIDGRPCRGNGIAGLQAIAVRPAKGGAQRTITSGDTVCGQFVEGREAAFLGLADAGRLVPAGERLTPGEQTRRTLAAVAETLDDCGWSFRNVRRTWFYLHHILDCYSEFNQVRNAAFRRMGLFEGQSLPAIPASTGIEGRNARAGVCTLDLLATAARGPGRHEVRRLAHAKQNEATEYGSAFSRGLSLRLESATYVFVSGTASIDEHGTSVHAGDFEAQTCRTLEAVKSVLAAGGATAGHIRQGTAFLKHATDLEAYRRIAREQGFAALPIVCMVADVCRDDLLFELDAAAVVY